MSTKTRVLDQFTEAVARLRQELPEMLLPDLQRLERAFKEIRQMNTTLRRKTDEAGALLPAVQRDAQHARAEAQQQAQQAASLAQRLTNKEQEVNRLQKALAETDALLVDQRAKGFNAEMLKDFLDQLEIDLRCALEENENTTTTEYPCEPKLRRFFERYGQFGGFVPRTTLAKRGKPTETAEAASAKLRGEVRSKNRDTYRAELDHLLALSSRLSFALECCKRPRQQFSRTFFIHDDGSVEQKEEWTDVEAVIKQHRRS